MVVSSWRLGHRVADVQILDSCGWRTPTWRRWRNFITQRRYCTIHHDRLNFSAYETTPTTWGVISSRTCARRIKPDLHFLLFCFAKSIKCYCFCASCKTKLLFFQLHPPLFMSLCSSLSSSLTLYGPSRLGKD